MTGGLHVADLRVRYGDNLAVDGIDLDVAEGEILALLGPNGAGKSSALDALSGMVPATGTMRVGDVDLRPLPPEARASYVAQVPEGRRLFPDHTVRENLLLAAYRANRGERARRLERVCALLPRLDALRTRRAGLLSGGEQQMVALGRGLMGQAPVLVIDELSLGLAPIITASFADALVELREEGLAILLVEQYVPLAMRIADRVAVMARGQIVLEGPTASVKGEALALQAAYLGS